MDHDVGTPFEGTQQVRAGERVVDDQRNPRLVGDRGDPFDVEHVTTGIADRFAVERLRLGSDRGAPGVEVVRVVDERRLDAEAGEAVAQEVVGAAVERRRRHDVITRVGEVEQRVALRGLTARHRQGAHTAFERCDPELEGLLGGVRQPGVDEADLVQVEQRGGMRRVTKDERGRLVDGDRPRSGGRIGLRAGVDLPRLELPRVLDGGGGESCRFEIGRFEVGAHRPDVTENLDQASQNYHVGRPILEG